MVIPRGQMLEAVKRGDLAEIKRLVQTHGLYGTPKSSKGCLLLAEALRNNRRDIAKLLLDYGATATYYSSEVLYRYSPLHLACTQGYHDIVELCIQRGADVNQRDRDLRTPLDYTTDIATARLLLQNGARLKNKSGHNQLYSRLRSLISHPSDSEAALDWLRLVDDYGGVKNLAGQSERCFDLLTYASTRVLRELLKRGLDVNATSRDGCHLIHDCALRGGPKRLKLLMEFGADVNARDGDGNSALHTSCKIYDSDECIEELLNSGLDPNMQNNRGETPLHIATESRLLNIVKILLDRGADVAARTKDGLTALHTALLVSEDDNYNSVTGLIELLLQKSSDVNAADADGLTPLHYAALDRKISELLLENGANINAEDNEGSTPLYFAILLDATDVFELLLNRGIDLPARFRNGTTPIHLAARGSLDTLELLCHRAQRLSTDIDCLDANGETPLFNALVYSRPSHWRTAGFLLKIGSSLDNVFWIDRGRMRDWFSTKPQSSVYWRSEQIRQLAIKLFAARLLPSFVAYDEARDGSDVLKYEEELKRLQKTVISRSMSLYDFLHNESRSAAAIFRLKHDLEFQMADFPNYRGLIESKVKIDLAYAEVVRSATRRLCLYTSRSPLLQHLIIPKEIIAKIVLLLTHRELNLLSRV